MARRDLAYIGGGLLSGIGKGLVAEAQGKAARDKARAALNAELARDVRKRDWAREDAETEREARKGEVQNYVETDEGFVGLTRGGGKVATGVKGKVGSKDKNLGTEVYAAQWFAAKKAAAEGREVSPDDELEAFQMIRQSKTDPNARKRLLLDAMEVVKESDPYREWTTTELQDEAKKLLDSFDGKPQAGGTKGGGKGPLTMEVKDKPGVVDRMLGNETAEAATPQQGRDLPGPPEVPGDGTEANPYRPTTQKQFDDLPANKVFVNPKDGKLYRKK